MARLTHNQKLFLCQKIAERRTFAQIRDCFFEEYEFPITNNQIDYLKRRKEKWVEIVEEMRANYDLAVSDLAMSSKRNRLEYLQEAFDDAKTATVEIFRNKSGDEDKEVIKKNPTAMVAAVRQAHEEMEGKSVQHKHSGKVAGGEKIFIISHIPPPDPLPDDIEEDAAEEE